MQALRLENNELRAQVAALSSDIRRAADDAGEESGRVQRAAVGNILEALAPVVVQMYVQRQLDAQSGGNTQDGSLLVGRLVQALSDAGLVLSGAVGEHTSFDPGRHEPSALGQPIALGARVVIRVPGATYLGRLLAKALVVPAES